MALESKRCELQWPSCAGTAGFGRRSGDVATKKTPQCIPPDPELLSPREDTTASSWDVTPVSSHPHQSGSLQLSSSSFSFLFLFLAKKCQNYAEMPGELEALSSQGVPAAPRVARTQTWQNHPFSTQPPASLHHQCLETTKKPPSASPPAACDGTKNPASSSKAATNIPGCSHSLRASSGAPPHPSAGCRDAAPGCVIPAGRAGGGCESC